MKLLTLARDLKRRKARERQSLFVAEGVRAVEELLKSQLAIEGVLVAPQLSDAPRGNRLKLGLAARNLPTTEVSELEFRSAAETDSPQGVLAIARIPDRDLDTVNVGINFRLLVLDGVQDPGNLGTILRTGAALGATGAVALPGTVDIWNAKVIRSAMGAHFQHPAFHTTPDRLFAFLEKHSIELWGAETGGEDVNAMTAPGRLALAVGNEGAGLSPQIRDKARRHVAVPIEAQVESLNVAVATGILLHSLRISQELS